MPRYARPETPFSLDHLVIIRQDLNRLHQRLVYFIKSILVAPVRSGLCLSDQHGKLFAFDELLA